ncbi:MAG: hypothetical protein IPL99_08285 [Candidatus Competibacteraceae bacterium]|nr:hypothetical protein [Candidatus Competibacteraceae bacterium]
MLFILPACPTVPITGKFTGGYISPKSRDWERGAQVTVRNDLKKDLDECLKKLAYHTGLIEDYSGWYQVLNANPEARLSLDHEDWLFFFGQGK